MKKYLYNLCFHIENAMLEGGYCIDSQDLSIADIKSEEEEDRFVAFENMISTHYDFCYKEWTSITDLEINDKLACSFTYNKYLPDKFFKSLSWFNKAIQQYVDVDKTQKELQNSLSEIEILDCCRNHKWETMTETTIIHTQCHYLFHFNKRVGYCETIVREIMKVLNIVAIETFDRIIKSRKVELNLFQIDYDKCVSNLQEGDDVTILKNNLLYYLERIALEIEFILGELNGCLRYSPWGFDVIRQNSLKNSILFYKRQLIIEKKKFEIEHKEIAITLLDIKSEKSIVIDKDDKGKILETIFPVSKRQSGMKMLDEVDKYYMISVNPKYPKRELGVIIYIMYCSRYVPSDLSFETFKQNICAYYGKENISIKPNKIRKEAINNYVLYQDMRYSKCDVNLYKLRGEK